MSWVIPIDRNYFSRQNDDRYSRCVWSFWVSSDKRALHSGLVQQMQVKLIPEDASCSKTFSTRRWPTAKLVTLLTHWMFFIIIYLCILVMSCKKYVAIPTISWFLIITRVIGLLSKLAIYCAKKEMIVNACYATLNYQAEVELRAKPFLL